MSNNYIAYTLVDITDIHKPSNTPTYNQKQNLNTFIQLAGLRSQPLSFIVTQLEAQDLVGYRFGKRYKGLHSVWKIEFGVEHSDVYTLDDNPVHFLESDFDQVPFTPYLNETVNFVDSTFDTYSTESLNIYFQIR